jgi:hypothetical protein
VRDVTIGASLSAVLVCAVFGCCSRSTVCAFKVDLPRLSFCLQSRLHAVLVWAGVGCVMTVSLSVVRRNTTTGFAFPDV